VFVLGIDPGVSRCGYAAVERRGGGYRLAGLGVVTTPKDEELPARLALLQRELSALFDGFGPSVLAIERVLFQVNVRTALSVGQASGLAMVEAARRGLAVVEYSPNQVKDAVVGYGGAGKEQVQHMVRAILGLEATALPPDAADAAAVALCHLAHAPSMAAAARSAARRVPAAGRGSTR
jgi:crossover junction endodeoxyribonuclease RuvC